MPLFEIETDSHIIITWAKDSDDASGVVAEAYPQDSIIRLTKRPRDTWVISKSAPGHFPRDQPVQYGQRLSLQGGRR